MSPQKNMLYSGTPKEIGRQEDLERRGELGRVGKTSQEAHRIATERTESCPMLQIGVKEENGDGWNVHMKSQGCALKAAFCKQRRQLSPDDVSSYCKSENVAYS